MTVARRVAIVIFGVVLATLLLVFGSLKLYEVAVLRKEVNEGKAILSRLEVDGGAEIPRNVIDVIYAVEGTWGASSSGLPTSVKAFVVDSLAARPERELNWQVRRLVWMLLIENHLSESEILALYFHFRRYGHGNNLAQAANYRFGKSLSDLSPSEVVTLQAAGRAPEYFSRNPDALRRMEDVFMARYRDWVGK